ncbi:MAG: hypothetical protein ACO4AU_04580, partial [bacterium]
MEFIDAEASVLRSSGERTPREQGSEDSGIQELLKPLELVVLDGDGVSWFRIGPAVHIGDELLVGSNALLLESFKLGGKVPIGFGVT